VAVGAAPPLVAVVLDPKVDSSDDM